MGGIWAQDRGLELESVKSLLSQTILWFQIITYLDLLTRLLLKEYARVAHCLLIWIPVILYHHRR